MEATLSSGRDAIQEYLCESAGFCYSCSKTYSDPQKGNVARSFRSVFMTGSSAWSVNHGEALLNPGYKHDLSFYLLLLCVPLFGKTTKDVFMADLLDNRKSKQNHPDREKEIPVQDHGAPNMKNELACLQGLYDLALTMTVGGNLYENLRRIAKKCRELLLADASSIALKDQGSDEFYIQSCYGFKTSAFKQMRFPFSKGLQTIFHDPASPRVFSDCTPDDVFDKTTVEILTHEHIVSGMVAPIGTKEENLGVLYVFYRSSRTFSQGDQDILCKITKLTTSIIHRKQTEELLRESEERFRFMAETTGDVIYRLKYESMTYDYLSPSIRKLTGYSPEEIKSIGFSKLVQRIELLEKGLVPPDFIVRNRTEGKIGEYRADYQILTKMGELKWVRDHSFPWLAAGNQIIGSVGILSDISDYKRAEVRVQERTNELIESEEKYRTLVENVPLVVYRMKPGKEILFVNHFVEEVLGYSPAKILGNPQLWTESLYDEDRARVMDLWKNSFENGKEFVAEYRVVHKNGHLVYVMDHAIPSQTADGNTYCLDGIIMDVTGRMRLQEQLVRSEGLKTIAEVSARLAHEFRNPLVSAGGFARRLLSGMKEDDPNRGKVEIIVKEVGRLEGILRMVLNYIQPVEVHRSATDPNQLVRKVIAGVDAEMRERNVRLDIQLSPTIPDISIDRPQMERVLETLIKNALNQMPQNAALSLSTNWNKQSFFLKMHYPVEHLSKDDVEHFFYPFTTFKTGYHTADLPFSKILVSKHGGEIDVSIDKSGCLLLTISLPF